MILTTVPLGMAGGVVVLSGLVCSTVISLTFLPAALVELQRWRRWS